MFKTLILALVLGGALILLTKPIYDSCDRFEKNKHVVISEGKGKKKAGDDTKQDENDEDEQVDGDANENDNEEDDAEESDIEDEEGDIK